MDYLVCKDSLSGTDIFRQPGKIVKTLVDRGEQGNERPWNVHKEQSFYLSKSFERLHEQAKAERLANCGSLLHFRECDKGHEKKLYMANFCRVRLCPMCAWRKSLVIFSDVMKIAHEAAKTRKLDYIMLTLTTRNVKGPELRAKITELFEAWQRLMQRKEVKAATIGWFRALEVTYNPIADTYHPHFHALLGVSTTYLAGKSYIKQGRWTELWQESAQLNYTPIVDVRAVKSKRQGQTIEAAAAEVGKYSVKPSDYLFDDQGDTDRAVAVFDKALKNRRLIAFGGLFRDLKKELKIADIENADLVHSSDEVNSCTCSICGSMLKEQLYKWHIGMAKYVQTDKSTQDY